MPELETQLQYAAACGLLVHCPCSLHSFLTMCHTETPKPLPSTHTPRHPPCSHSACSATRPYPAPPSGIYKPGAASPASTPPPPSPPLPTPPTPPKPESPPAAAPFPTQGPLASVPGESTFDGCAPGCALCLAKDKTTCLACKDVHTYSNVNGTCVCGAGKGGSSCTPCKVRVSGVEFHGSRPMEMSWDIR